MLKNIKFIILIFLFYQTPVNSKSVSFDDFNSKKLITNKVVTQGYFLKKLGILPWGMKISKE